MTFHLFIVGVLFHVFTLLSALPSPNKNVIRHPLPSNISATFSPHVFAIMEKYHGPSHTWPIAWSNISVNGTTHEYPVGPGPLVLPYEEGLLMRQELSSNTSRSLKPRAVRDVNLQSTSLTSGIELEKRYQGEGVVTCYTNGARWVPQWQLNDATYTACAFLAPRTSYDYTAFLYQWSYWNTAVWTAFTNQWGGAQEVVIGLTLWQCCAYTQTCMNAMNFLVDYCHGANPDTAGGIYQTGNHEVYINPLS